MHGMKLGTEPNCVHLLILVKWEESSASEGKEMLATTKMAAKMYHELKD